MKFCVCFYDLIKGCILFGGVLVWEIEFEKLMSCILMVFQDVYLFQDSICNNIWFGKSDVIDEEIVVVVKKVCCYNFIMYLLYGYDIMVGEGGCMLLGGEK